MKDQLFQIGDGMKQERDEFVNSFNDNTLKIAEVLTEIAKKIE
jgi:hypothetical protein